MIKTETRPVVRQILEILSIIFILVYVPNANADIVGGFSAAELKSILPILKQYGSISLAETLPDGSPKAMTLALRINAPRKEAFKVFENPENFSYISRLFRENKILQKHDGSTAYSWASRHKWFSFVGTNIIALYPPRRIDVSITKSSIGSGDVRMLFYEDGPDHSIFVMSGIIDVQSSEWLIRYLIGVNPAMRLAMNVAIGLVVVKGVEAMAKRAAAGKPLGKHITKGKRKGPLKPLNKGQLDALRPLLNRGAVVLTKSVKHGRLSQATVIEKVKAPGKKFLVAAATPEFYSKMVKAISDINVHERTKQATEFSWTIGFSIFGLTSRNRLTFTPDGVLIEGLNGDLAGAQWRWQITDNGPNECIVAYHSWADMSITPYILKQSVKAEPYLEHGFMAGSNMVMLRALKKVVEMN
ncbi:MAG: hypothetical protein GY847_13710 [Proteobacteria bacterium]|nr:hypothetical protein [Pseudomonadota bacterium]